MKLVLAAWLVLPQFMGAAFLYERFVREHIRRYVTGRGQHQQVHHEPKTQQQPNKKSPSGSKSRKKFVDFIIPKKVSCINFAVPINLIKIEIKIIQMGFGLIKI